jgi:hypothetical protein
MIPVVDAENETLQMFEMNQSSRAAVGFNLPTPPLPRVLLANVQQRRYAWPYFSRSGNGGID